MSTSSRPPSIPQDLDLTILSAKHLKNVNWRNGILKPYCIFWVDPDRRLATKSDDHGSTKPTWNEQFLLPLTLPLHNSVLTLEIFHSKPTETNKPLVGTICIQLRDLYKTETETETGLTRNRDFELRRPSGRPQGKIRLRLAVQARPMNNYQITLPPPPNYQNTPPQSYHPPPPPSSYNLHHRPPAPPAFPSPPPHPPYGGGGGYGDGYSSYYQGYYPRYERQSSYGGIGAGPSAPVDYMSYDQKRGGGGKGGWGAGLGVGAVAGALGGLALDEGVDKYGEERVSERVESEVGVKDDYGNYRVDY